MVRVIKKEMAAEDAILTAIQNALESRNQDTEQAAQVLAFTLENLPYKNMLVLMKAFQLISDKYLNPPKE